MKIVKTKVNFKDKRGEIRDLLVGEKIDTITLITCKKGSVRGNHYHKKTDQFDYILSGEFMCSTKDMKVKNTRKTDRILKVGDLAYHPKNEAHSFKALKDGSFLSITRGPRKGNNFEKDTYRLEELLLN